MNLSIHVFGLPLIDIHIDAAEHALPHGHDELEDGHQYIKIDGEVFELLPEDEDDDDELDQGPHARSRVPRIPFGFCA